MKTSQFQPNYGFLRPRSAPPTNYRFLGNAFKPRAAPPSTNYGFLKPRAAPPSTNYGFLGNAFKPRVAPVPTTSGNLGNALKPPVAPFPTTSEKLPGGNTNKPIVEALQTVPGGLPELAIAAEALNETAGNIQEAKIKGATPEGIKAVKKLGGHKKTISLLNKPSIRNGALNNFLNSVKKQKLISIIAHKITKTNNIHPDEEHLKAYYKKIAKSYIKKTPFANVVRRAAKKNVM